MTQTSSGREPRFPFTAIVGQTPMKRALLLNAINPRIGGVLVRGKKGTAKSTAVRSLAALLPQVPVVPGCPYSCPPDAPQDVCQPCQQTGRSRSPSARRVRIVDLPVGATEDRLVGSLDIERAIKSGEKNFEPGLIAAAHRGILYIDEVNLLNDHLVDVLLDAAAMGRNYVEREGISVSHDAEFMLVGTMNPEEGDLRPQLLDRFGLAVEVDGVFEQAERREVVRRRMAFESNPFDFMDGWADAEQAERERLLSSQRLLADVVVPDEILELITDICAEYQVDGLRGDIVMYKTASTIAAYEGRTVVDVEDVREAALMPCSIASVASLSSSLTWSPSSWTTCWRTSRTTSATASRRPMIIRATTTPATPIAIENPTLPKTNLNSLPTPLSATNGSRSATPTPCRTSRFSPRTAAPADLLVAAPPR